MKTKVCTKCKEEKSLDSFYKATRLRLGLQSECKSCANERSIAWQKKNREKVNLRHREWRRNNPEKRKAIEKRSKQRPEYKEKARLNKRKRYYLGLDNESRIRYQSSDKGKVAAKKAKQKWNKNNPEKIREKDRMLIKNLSDCYVISKIQRGCGLSAETIRNNKELIEIKRLIIKTKRLWKTSLTSEKA